MELDAQNDGSAECRDTTGLMARRNSRIVRAPRRPVPGELLFEFVVDHDRYRFELRDHGPDLGVGRVLRAHCFSC